jgi:hypothetical protein
MWSFSVNEIMQDYEMSEALLEEMGAINPLYPQDMADALITAKQLGLSSGTLSGFRTDSPYGGPQTAGISVMGTAEPVNWQDAVKANIARGPDCTHDWVLKFLPEDESATGNLCVKCGERQGGSIRYD